MSRILLAATLSLAALSAHAEPFTVVALGDTAYGDPAEVYPIYQSLIDTINAAAPKLVVHVGDTKSGSTPCSDEALTQQLAYLNSFAAPVLYSIGDNEWTDCHRKKAGSFDPLERLAFLRTTYFKDGAHSFGQTPVEVTSQAAAGYPENARYMMNDVAFITAHVPGSNNNFEVRDIKAVEEFFARDAADVTWLQDSFAAAKDAKAIVVGIQANMFESDWNLEGDYAFSRQSGYMNFATALREAATAFGKPVLLVYGDSHVYGEMRPFPLDAPNLLALEVPGEAMMHAVEITIDPATSGVFSTRILINPAVKTE
jgi:hypothetical protein